MRTKIVTTGLFFLISSFLLSQNPKQYKHILFKNQNKKEKYQDLEIEKLESFFSYIPSTTYKMNDGKYVSAKGFYMLRFEVPNVMYKWFINDLRQNNKTEDLKTALPDTNSWGNSNDPYVNYYFNHPSFNSYPVVSVSRNGVKMFCNWLNEKVKTLKLKIWKGKKVEFRLPTEVEWMIAAAGGDTNAVFAWKGATMKMGPGPWGGDYMANFRRVGDGDVYRGEDGKLTIKKSDNEKYKNHFPVDFSGEITAPINCYWPNDYGLYCMTGNVREMVQEEGFTKGGGWIDPGGECMIDFRNTYQREGAPCEGFRIIAVVE